MSLILAYWDIRGLAQPIRLLLEYAKVKYEDKYYVCGPAPDYDKSTWLNEKYILGLDFPNLPYLIDGDIKLTQSFAIIQHLARKHDLYGKNETERSRADMVAYQMSDLKLSFSFMCYNQDFQAIKKEFLATLPSKLKLFEDYIGENKWFAGDNITYVDFLVYEILDQILILDSDALRNCPNLSRFLKLFANLERIKEYLSSDRCIKKKLNNRIARFGNGIDN